ncbi:hypothetical protein [Propylenella binzhouense]|uniref:Uncharacterized protein n=1 Tax=Propylenella binzhouense TaxID=2555902 RepID=A0A964T307_9HYPH|nr:hypothetical protein [Propylenella binzhouense]MYZ47561.1 hypothetical protein [Propylenella binzhouense]
MRERRLHEFAFLLPWLGVFLTTPPTILALASWSRAAGFPVFIVYIFAVWAMLIAAAFLLARRLPWSDERQGADAPLSGRDGANG